MFGVWVLTSNEQIGLEPTLKIFYYVGPEKDFWGLFFYFQVRLNLTLVILKDTKKW